MTGVGREGVSAQGVGASRTPATTPSSLIQSPAPNNYNGIPGSWDPNGAGAPHFADLATIQVQLPNAHV